MTDHATDESHDALSCPQCIGMAEAAKITGGFAEAMQRMIDDGTFFRAGQEAARRKNEAFWEAFLSEKK